jgi:hypothetical protein
MTNQDSKTMELALGRILRMASRPTQAGDVAEYERCRAIIMDLAEPVATGYTVSYARDWNRGAQGDAA